ncbi:MAG: hypothetical protein EOO07_10065 [Chitinophagaceae bacterium]|nr:MAG: hypothetical protein EOO07_10065 [Chitinophagaceae bacterium]
MLTMNYAKKIGLQTGDQIVTPLFALGLSKHFAVYLGFENGIEWIAENHKVLGVRVIPAWQYFKDVTVISRIDQFKGTAAQRMVLMKKARSLAGTPYNLISYNCEHFATELTSGVSASRQVSFAALGLFGLLLFNSLKK